MLYTRKRNMMDPNRINNYNKFLSTLDQSSNNINIDLKPPISFDKQNDLSGDDFKNTVNNIIDKITQNYNLNNHSSVNFNGFNPIDSCCITNKDPNYYRDISKPIMNYNKPYITQIKIDQHEKPFEPLTLPLPEVEIKEFINIETEINNISDILTLIDTYKLDPSIKYNINMKTLHDIKKPLEELNNMIGMKEFKNNIVDQILYFTQELHKSNRTTGDFMHTVIYGPPGTGKTELAKIMGKLYSKLGVLSRGTFKKVTRSDLIAGYLGQTALKTSEVIKEAIGGVLFIDEAYALGNPEKKDSFAKECIDTLCEALSDNKDDLMVIIAGYEKELKDCFFIFNQGLESRFTWRFKTDEYSGEDLYHIFLKMVKDIGWECEDTQITANWFNEKKEYFKFYGRDIETVLAKTKIAHSRRIFCKSENEKRKIILKDLDKGFEFYLKNEDVKNRKNDIENKKLLYNTLYC